MSNQFSHCWKEQWYSMAFHGVCGYSLDYWYHWKIECLHEQLSEFVVELSTNRNKIEATGTSVIRATSKSQRNEQWEREEKCDRIELWQMVQADWFRGFSFKLILVSILYVLHLSVQLHLDYEIFYTFRARFEAHTYTTRIQSANKKL